MVITKKPDISLVHRFFAGTGTSYDHIVNLCTFGFDRLWKQKMLEKIPQGAKRIMDQACGTGIFTCRIAQEFPQCQVIGVDVLDEYLAIAREKTRKLRLSNVSFVLGRAEDVLLEEGFDCITSSYLAKYADLGGLIRNTKMMLRDGGNLILHDFTYPRNRAFSVIWELYFKLLQTVGSWKYPSWKTVFDGLPGLLRDTRWVSESEIFLQEYNFSNTAVEYFTFGTSAIVTAQKQ
jgi:demethylmenaquinone methyltransferase / 2-methoxy-6-polyprenyl-1,4-benzoquinol methylase